MASSASASPGDRPIYRAQNLAKIYGSGATAVHALRGVDLTVGAGEQIVLLGTSGSGKSTLLNILGGLDRASSGTAWFRERALTALEDRELTAYRRRHVGFVFQFYNLMPALTAAENVELVTEIASRPMAAREALALVDLADRADSFPSQLSGGQQQRIAIARAIAKRPEVLLCDEPTGALDTATSAVVLKAIDQANRELGTTALLITHNPAIAGMADRTLHMRDGGIERVDSNARRQAAAALEL